MLLKIYGMTWTFIALVAALMFLTGSLTTLVGVGFGFVCFGMIFMGMMNVLPSIVAHNAPLKTAEMKIEIAEKETVEVFPAGVVPIR